MVLFFFSSRRRHTRLQGDWSSDVCSSDLLMSAGLRLGLIGHTDGQRILAGLEPLIASAAAAAKRRDPADFGSATFAVDLASMVHETQYSRLFRSWAAHLRKTRCATASAARSAPARPRRL